MTSTEYLARQLADLQRRMAATERATRLQYSTVGIATSSDDDAPVIDLDVSGALFTGVEASVDAATALTKAGLAARTFNQDLAPTPAEQDDGVIPVGSLWTNTSNGNAQFRWSSAQTWIPLPLDDGALTPQLLALIRMRFADAAERDALIPFPDVGMEAYLASDGLKYQYSTYGWTPIARYVKKAADSTTANNAIIDVLNPDPDLRVILNPGTYRVEAFLHYNTPNAAGFRAAWVFSGSVVKGNRSCRGQGVGQTDTTASLMRNSTHLYSTAVNYGGTMTGSFAYEDLLMRVDSTGVLSLCWSQATANAGTTTLQAASRVYVDMLRDTV